MATSTFSKQFAVRPEKEDEFVKEMTKAVTPTLRSDFRSNSVHLNQEKDLKNNLLRVLNKK